MSEIILNLEPVISLPALKERFESITREYSLAVIEGTESGKDYPDAAENIRFLFGFIFELCCNIEDNKNLCKDDN